VAVPPVDSASATPRRREVGVSLIVFYKLGKAAVQAAAAIALELASVFGTTARIDAHARAVALQLAGTRSATLAKLIERLVSPARLRFIIVALVLDAAVSALEGWALHRRFAWAPWLIVVATGSLLPLEVVHLARHPRPAPALLLAINAAAVGYLIVRARRHARAGAGTAAVSDRAR
jgi:uncharacterized membrane protein (DUF2068 family)